MSVLIICEKPSVAKTVALALGAAEQKDGYLSGDGLLVSWCIGHLISMADAGSYDERYKKWRYEDLPILPQTWKYAPTPGKEKQLAVLKELLHRSDISEVVNGCDAGREGELIFRFVYEQAGCTKPFSRLWISSMEDSAIRKGFAERRAGTEYDALYQSALCRARADWLVGINATRLFSVLYHKTLNVGRVLSPTLNLLVERDGKITMFHKEKYHIVHIGCGGVDAESERISDAAAADTLRTTCEASQAVCVSLKKEKKTALPPKLFDLTCLQREANRVYGFTAKQTLDYAQSLYEKRFLTYPRTDSNYLTEDMAQTATDLVAALLPVLPFMRGAELVPEIGRVINSAKVSDHHAIIPTAAFAGNGFDGLPESEKKLMSLVCCKLLCAVAAPQEYETVTAVFDCGGKQFTAKGSDDPQSFMQGIEDMTRELVKQYSHITEDGKKLFAPEKEAVGICPRCKSPVYEGKKNFYCSDRSCRFVMWKNDKFFESRRTVFSKKIAAALLKDGKAKVKGLYSERTGKTYDGTVLLCDTGEKYVNYRIEQRK